MAVTSGFFNSIDGDRKYDALQMAELFDGIINDGVYATIYKQFRVTQKTGYTIQVDSGRGWFQHTWIKNDGAKLLTLDDPEVLYNRIDAVIIEVDHNNAVRSDSIKIVKGTPSANPVRPALVKAKNVYQYPLAYIDVKRGAIQIEGGDITNMVGTSECPFVTGPLEVMNIDMLVAQWQDQFQKFMQNDQIMWDDWFSSNTSKFYYDFNNWFTRIKTMLEPDVAARLAQEILDLQDILRTLVEKGYMLSSIQDQKNDPLLDTHGEEINGTIMFGENVIVSGGNSPSYPSYPEYPPGDSCDCEAMSSEIIDNIWDEIMVEEEPDEEPVLMTFATLSNKGDLDIYHRLMKELPSVGEVYEEKTIIKLYPVGDSDFHKGKAMMWTDDSSLIFNIKLNDEWSPRNLSYFAANLDSIKSIDLGPIDVSEVTDMSYMFANLPSQIKELDVTDWDVTSVKSIEGMFAEDKDLKTIKGIEEWSTSSIENMNYTFMNCESLTDVDLSSWIAIQVKSHVDFATNADGVTEPDWEGSTLPPTTDEDPFPPGED